MEETKGKNNNKKKKLHINGMIIPVRSEKNMQSDEKISKKAHNEINAFNRSKNKLKKKNPKDISFNPIRRNHLRQINHEFGVLNSLPLGVLCVDINGEISFANNSVLKILKLNSITEIIGTNIKKWFSEEDGKEAGNDIFEYFNTKKETSIFMRMYRNDRTLFHAELISNMLTISGLDSPLLAIVLQNIEQRRDYEESITSERNLFRKIFDSFPDSIFIKDREGKYIYTNYAFRRILRISHCESLINKTDYDLTSKEKADQYLEEDRMIIDSGMPIINKEEKVIDKFGNEIWSVYAKFPMKDNGDDTEYIVGVSQNITYRKIVEDALIKSERDYKTLFENAHDAIIIFTPENERIIDLNKRACELYGFTRNEFIGMSLEAITYDVKAGKIKLAELISKGSALNHHSRHYKKDGSLMEIEINAAVINYRSRVSILCIIRDITARIVAEESIKQSELKLKELNDTKNKLFSVIAHDLRAPFTALLGLTQYMSNFSETMSAVEMRDCAFHINESTRNVLNLVENLLNWTKLQRDGLKLNNETIRLKIIINDLIILFRDSISKKKITINNYIPEDLFLFVDRNMIESVFRNLLSNAIKYSLKGGDINVFYEDGQKYNIISVMDYGMGMSEVAVERLFKPGAVQSVKGSCDESGSGIGLIICKEFIEKIGGKIKVESKMNFGSKFAIYLPKLNTA